MIEWLYSIDHNIMLFIQNNLRFDVLTPIMKAISASVNLGLLWIFIGLALLCFKKTRLIGAVVLAALTVGLLTNNVLVKNIVDRARPYECFSDIIPLIPSPHGSSFASGHTTASFAAAGVAVRFFNKRVSAVVIIYAVLVGLSRMYLGVHYPSDVLGGCIIGIAGSLLVYYIFSKKFELEKYKLKTSENNR